MYSLLICFLYMIPPTPRSTLFPYTTLFRSILVENRVDLIEQPFPIGQERLLDNFHSPIPIAADESVQRSEEHTSELQSRFDLVCRVLLEKTKKVCGYESVVVLSNASVACLL